MGWVRMEPDSGDKVQIIATVTEKELAQGVNIRYDVSDILEKYPDATISNFKIIDYTIKNGSTSATAGSNITAVFAKFTMTPTLSGSTLTVYTSSTYSAFSGAYLGLSIAKQQPTVYMFPTVSFKLMFIPPSLMPEE